MPNGKKPTHDDLRIWFAGQTYTITGLAFLLMLAGILLPTVKYAYYLREPSPAQLLVAVCMALFSAVLFLWILDATSILPFRSPWVSRSVYGAAIVSVLGTSVAVYRDAFASSKYPYEGLWEVTISESGQTTPISQHRLLLGYSTSAETYWGFSDTRLASPESGNATMSTQPNWIEVTEFLPVDQRMVIEMHRGPELLLLRADKLTIRPRATYVHREITTEDKKTFGITMTRAK